MSNPVSVKWFDSTMAGAPALSGTAGTLISVLDACLVNGFGSVTLDSLVVSGGVATATKSAGHGFLDHVVVLIAGATPSGLNGEKRITRVSSSVFTFDATGIANQTATGTITAKMAPVGWTKAYSGTNKAAYARSAPAATAMLLRVDDSGTTMIRLIGYETMSDIDTGTGPFPTEAQESGGTYFSKSSAAGSTARPWRLFADGQALYLFSADDGASYYGMAFFGDVIPLKTPDAYCCAIIASSSNRFGAQLIYVDGTNSNAYFTRAVSQSGTSVQMRRYSHRLTQYLGVAGFGYPDAVSGGLVADTVEAWEAGGCRGRMPGLYNPLHNTALTDNTIVYDALDGRAVKCIAMGSTMRAAFDLTGPWR